MLNTEQELSSLVEKIQTLEGKSKVVMEATESYHLPILYYILDHNISVSVTNPLVMKKYSSIVLRKGKTDKTDSVRIANYGIGN